MIPLSERSCQPCSGNIPPMSTAQSEELITQLPDWVLAADGKSIERKVNAGTFARAMDQMSAIAEVAEEGQHHPDLHLTGYRHLRVCLTTHAIGGLSESDFIVAAKINQRLALD